MELSGATQQNPIPYFQRNFENYPTKAIWTPEDDEVLKGLIDKYGAHRWTEIAEMV